MNRDDVRVIRFRDAISLLVRSLVFAKFRGSDYPTRFKLAELFFGRGGGGSSRGGAQLGSVVADCQSCAIKYVFICVCVCV